MGQGQEVKTRIEPQVEIQERREIFFFYRPKVDKEEAHSVDDVQRLYGQWKRSKTLIQARKVPRRGPNLAKVALARVKVKEVNIEKQPLFRFILVGRKSLPDPRKKGRPYWGFVEMVTTNIDDVKTALKGEEYDTPTRGHRRKPPARALGEGIYRILRHESGKRTHTHLVYKLEFPPQYEKNEPQESLNIEREGSFLIQIKNPDQHGTSQFRGLQNKRKAVFPAHLQARFGKLRYCPADPPDLLNYEGCEFLLISASDDIEEELDLELKTEGECCDASCSDLVKTFG